MGYFLKRSFPTAALVAALVMTMSIAAQNFGMAVTQKKIMLERKLPPTGHIEGTAIKVVVTAHGLQSDLATDLKSSLENILLRNDTRLRTEENRAETIVTCTITSYAQPPPQTTVQSNLNVGKGSLIQKQALERVTGVLSVGFQARDRGGRSLASDNVTAKFDGEFSASGADKGFMHSVTHSVKHIAKGASDDDTPPTSVELHDRLVQDAAQQIAAHLVNTTEQVQVYLARGGGLDDGDKLLESKLWSRALESFETMKPFGNSQDDAYRLYDIGVANEALAYSAEDVKKARTYLQEAAINYGKAIDAKPTERKFLEPQTRIDTALAHYKMLGDRAAANKIADASQPSRSSASEATVPARASASSTRTSAPQVKAPASNAASSDTLTNEGVMMLVANKIDDDNVIDTIRHSPSVRFDLSVQGQVNLSKSGVSNRVLTAMKARSRGAGSATHHTQ